MMKGFLFFILICCGFSVYAQQNAGLFVHTDKTIYLKNETIWFSAYLFATVKDQNKHSLLNVVISSADSGKVFIAEQYPMDNGISIGKLILPDSIKQGIYKFIAYTDMIGTTAKPAIFFSTTLTIGSPFETSTQRTSINLNPTKEASVGINNLAQLSTNLLEYGKREEVTLKIKVQEPSLFSVAVVYNARLNSDLQKITETSVTSLTNNSDHLQPPITLQINYKNKPLNKAIEVLLFGNDGIKFFSTDETGQLKLERSALLSTYGKKIAVMVGGQKAKDYQITLHNPTLQAGVLLAKENIISPEQLLIRKQNNQLVPQTGTEKTVELNTVIVKGKAGGSSALKGKFGINDCGDWVDEYDYLNYPYSEKRYHPIIGKLYKKRTDLDQVTRSFKVEPIYYTGCEGTIQKTATLIKGVNLETPFYGLDNSSSQPQYLTTLYWGVGLLSNKQGEAELRFSTADLSGTYRIVLQGITNHGVCYGEVVFVVK